MSDATVSTRSDGTTIREGGREGGREERERRPSIVSDWVRPESAVRARLDDGNAPPRRLAPPPLSERDTSPVRATRDKATAA